MSTQYPDLAGLNGVVPDAVLSAMRIASNQLRAVGIRHALAGGLAVGAWGYPRYSKGVDFLVGNEAFSVHESGLVTFAPGVPISIGNVPVDSLSASVDEGFLAAAIDSAVPVDGIPVLPVEALVYMKLKSPREKDRADVVELVKAGTDTGAVRAWLALHAPKSVDRFEGLVAAARKEEAER